MSGNDCGSPAQEAKATSLLFTQCEPSFRKSLDHSSRPFARLVVAACSTGHRASCWLCTLATFKLQVGLSLLDWKHLTLY